MKLRVSMGLVGNDKAGNSRFLYTSDPYSVDDALPAGGGKFGHGYFLGIENSTASMGAFEKAKNNQNVTWEKAFKQNYGVDFTLMDERLNVNVDYYKEKRRDILLRDYTAAGILGFITPYYNMGRVNSWGWELSMKWDDKIGDKFRYWVGLNLSNNENKIIEKKINGLFTINRKTLGSSGSVKSITIKEIKDVYDNIYIPCNQFLVLAGNFDYDKTLSLVKNIYKEISFKNDKRLSKVSDVKNVIKKRTIYKSDYIDEVILTFKIDVSSLSCFDKYKLDWYLSFFLDINFSKYSKINEYINNCSDYTDDISAYLYYFNGYFVIDVIAFTKKVNDFEKLVLSSIKNRDSSEREVFELVKKDAITRISVRKDSISSYVAPTEENYIRFGYLDDDDIDVIDKFNYSEYDKIISNIDFTNYSVFYRKKK